MKDERMPRIEIKTTGARSKVFINGQYVPGVGKIEFEHRPLQAPVLKLSFPAVDLTWEMLGPIRPELPEALKFWYVPRNHFEDKDGEEEKRNE